MEILDKIYNYIREVAEDIREFFHYLKAAEHLRFRLEPGDAQSLMANSKGEITFQVTRESQHIPYALPVVFFAPNALSSSYFQFIDPFLEEEAPGAPFGFSVTIDQPTGDILINYTLKFVGSDTIRIHALGNISASAFVSAMNTSFFKFKLISYSITDATLAAEQFQNDFNYAFQTSIQGLQNFNIWRLMARILPSNNADNAISVVVKETKINAEFGFTQLIIRDTNVPAANPGFTSEYTFFMSQEIKTDDIGFGKK